MKELVSMRPLLLQKAKDELQALHWTYLSAAATS